MIRLEPAGAEALLLVLAEQPDADLPQRINQLAGHIRQLLGPAVIDLVPSWTTLLVHYDLLKTSHADLVERLEPLLENWLEQALLLPTGRLLELPVWYAGEDLALVAQACSLDVDEVIRLHSATEYRVGAIGFAPGFAYMRELDAQLALPRRSTPRISVPAGSVAIVERQTAVYPQASPGGWHLLGLCPWRLFDLQAAPPCLFAIGDRVRFVPVSRATYLAEGGHA
jgi:KipI family sensor histidine kinase inhibitor